MTKVMRIGGEDVEIRPIKPLRARIMRAVCTEFGLAETCSFSACRRGRRCAAAEVYCYQALRQEINAILMPALRARANGAERPEWPSREDWEAFRADQWPDSATPDKLDGT